MIYVLYAALCAILVYFANQNINEDSERFKIWAEHFEREGCGKLDLLGSL